ncbi:PulJ/GspJ family protein [Azospira restricta]|uniref:Type II secretion system protein n=1 Tax=Azospira restricta TaxID=404405 RepID=A0A974Y560_9RHOO|nr:type II secretion system protein [Azospira restricta]QRJ65090.1 type II secretion system protein [Azospira restricta]
MMKRARGVTLVEMIVTIVVLGIVAGIISMFIRVPIDSYIDAGRRARLTDAADLALRRMTRELRLALPNSVRVTNVGTVVYIEFMLTREGGFYRAQPTAAPGTEDILDFGSADNTFQIFASSNAIGATDWIAIANLGSGSGSDAYAGDNIVRVSAFNAGTGVLTLAAATLFPVPAPDQRFQVVTDRVTYECDPATGQLRRHAGYGIVLASAAQPTPPAGGTQSLMVDRVLGCTFVYDANVSNVRTGIVSLSLTLGEAGESVTLFHQVHVSNAS